MNIAWVMNLFSETGETVQWEGLLLLHGWPRFNLWLPIWFPKHCQRVIPSAEPGVTSDHCCMWPPNKQTKINKSISFQHMIRVMPKCGILSNHVHTKKLIRDQISQDSVGIDWVGVSPGIIFNIYKKLADMENILKCIVW